MPQRITKQTKNFFKEILDSLKNEELFIQVRMKPIALSLNFSVTCLVRREGEKLFMTRDVEIQWISVSEKDFNSFVNAEHFCVTKKQMPVSGLGDLVTRDHYIDDNLAHLEEVIIQPIAC